MSDNTNRDTWRENIILVDADYVDKVAFDLTVNFERMIGRRIPKADMARWLECAALDGGLRPVADSTPSASVGRQEVQVVLLHRKGQMDNFEPGTFADIDGRAFQGALGEFLISCVQVEEMVTMDSLFIDSLQMLANAPEVKRLIVVPDTPYIYNKVREVMRRANPDLHSTVLTMQPTEGGAFRQELLGYSLMAALGIKSEELNQAR